MNYWINFGLPSQRAPWGDRVWDGMEIYLDNHYPEKHQRKLSWGKLFRGFFQCPADFSHHNAEHTPPGEGDDTFYPSWFIVYIDPSGKVVIIMICLAILLEGSRPWYIHEQRVFVFFQGMPTHWRDATVRPFQRSFL